MSIELNRTLLFSTEQLQALPPPPKGYIYSITHRTKGGQVYLRCERPIMLKQEKEMIYITTERLKLYTIAQVTKTILQKMQEIWADVAVMMSYGGTKDSQENKELLYDWVSKREFFVIEERGEFIGFFFTGFSKNREEVEIATALHPYRLKERGGALASGKGIGEEATHAIVNIYLPTTLAKRIIAYVSPCSNAEKIVRKLGFTFCGDRKYQKPIE